MLAEPERDAYLARLGLEAEPPSDLVDAAPDAASDARSATDDVPGDRAG